MNTIYKREMSSFFKSPIAYVIIAVYLFVFGYFSMSYNFAGGSVYIGMTLQTMTSILPIIIPIITMKLLAEEKRNGTEVLLRTSPISMWEVVLGKFFAAYTLFALMNAATLIHVFLMSAYAPLPVAETVGAYLGYMLQGLLFVAVGIFASSITESQIIAAIVGVVILFSTTGLYSIGSLVGGWFGNAIMWISPLTKYAEFANGMINFASIVFYVSFAAVMLLVTESNMERKRWN